MGCGSSVPVQHEIRQLRPLRQTEGITRSKSELRLAMDLLNAVHEGETKRYHRRRIDDAMMTRNIKKLRDDKIRRDRSLPDLTKR